MPRKPLPRHPVTQPSDPSYRLIALTQGKTAIVDTADFQWLSAYSWSAWKNNSGNWYAAARVDGRVILMHQLLTGYHETDHRNRDGLDNRRRNLRNCTRGQNNANSRKHKNTSSSFKGVSFRRDRGTWSARLKFNDVTYYLGTYPTEEAAARAYREKAAEIFGEFCRF